MSDKDFDKAFDFAIGQEGVMSNELKDGGINPPSVICSECFRDQGLRLDAEQLGKEDSTKCPNCGSTIGYKLSIDKLLLLTHRFFVWGSLLRFDYGAAPLIIFNEHQKTDIHVPAWLKDDVHLLEHKLGVGFFHYGPRYWMFGEIEPLKALKNPTSRSAIIERIIREYPSQNLAQEALFYRIRKFPTKPNDPQEYDSPPTSTAGNGRLDSPNFPVMYASPDLQVCIHECRITAEDETYVATLTPASPLHLLDLSRLLIEEHVTEFESLDLAIHMLFLAGIHSYPITRSIARAVHLAGFDGIVYPSYFSLLHTGHMPFETIYGISTRRIPQLRQYEQFKTTANFALFGHPIAANKIQVHCINKLILNHVEYGVHFGPISL